MPAVPDLMLEQGRDIHAQARVRLVVNGHPLEPLYVDLLERVQLQQDFDGADMLTLDFKAWDSEAAQFRVVGENVIGPGAKVEFLLGYGHNLTHKGRFDITGIEPSFEGDVPKTTIVGYNGLHRFLDNRQPLDLGTPRTYTEAAGLIAQFHGMGFDGDESRKIQHRTKTVTRRRKVKAGILDKLQGKPGYSIKRIKATIKTRLIKKAGETDLAFLKWLALSAGFLLPRVRFSPEQQRDVLEFKRPDLAGQVERVGQFVFRYRDPSNGNPATCRTFRPSLSVKGLPTAVRITGLSPGGRRLQVVEAEVDPTEFLQFGASAIRINTKDGGPPSKQDRKIFNRPGVIALEVLGEEKAGEILNPVKRRKEQGLVRDVIKPVIITGIRRSLPDMARAWLEARLALFITGEAEIDNVPGTEVLEPNQVHKFMGMTAEYEGQYMLRSANHIYDPQAKHKVGLTVQKLAEVRSGSRPVELRTRAQRR